MLRFEKLECVIEGYSGQRVTYRAKIRGGWLVGMPDSDKGMTFVLDPEHKWDGNSLQ